MYFCLHIILLSSFTYSFFPPIKFHLNFDHKDTDEWYAAVIVGRKDIAVPHTEIVLRTFEVTYVRITDPVGEIENIDEIDDEKEGARVEGGDVEEGVTEKGGENKIIGVIKTRNSGYMEDIEMEEDKISSIDFPTEKISESVIEMPTVGDITIEGNPIVKKRRTSRWDNQSTALPYQSSLSTTLSDSSQISIQLLSPLPPPLPIETSIPPPPPPPPPPRFSAVATKDLRSLSSVSTANKSESEVVRDFNIDMPIPVIEKSLNENDEDNYKNQTTEEEKEPIVETVVISGIRSDHLRLLCDDEGKVFGASGKVVFQVPSMAKAPPLAVVDQSTGNKK